MKLLVLIWTSAHVYGTAVREAFWALLFILSSKPTEDFSWAIHATLASTMTANGRVTAAVHGMTVVATLPPISARDTIT